MTDHKRIATGSFESSTLASSRRTRLASALGMLMVLLLVAAGCSGSDDDDSTQATAASDAADAESTSTSAEDQGDDADDATETTVERTASADADPWIDSYCSALQNLTSEDGLTANDAVPVEVLSDSLDAADDAADGPPEVYSDGVETLRTAVEKGSSDYPQQAPYGLCFDYFFGGEGRVVLSETSEDAQVCGPFDQQLADELTGDDSRSQMSQFAGEISLWSDASGDDPLDGIAVRISAPLFTFDELPDGASVDSTIGEGPVTGVSEAAVTIDLPTTDQTADEFDSGSLEIEVTIVGADNEAAAAIVDSLEIKDGQVNLDYDDMKQIVVPVDSSLVSVTDYGFLIHNANDESATVLPSPMSMDDFMVMTDFATAAEGGPETTMEEIDVPSGSGYLITDDTGSGVLLEVDDSLMLLVPIQAFDGEDEQLTEWADLLTTATPEQWADYLLTAPNCPASVTG